MIDRIDPCPKCSHCKAQWCKAAVRVETDQERTERLNQHRCVEFILEPKPGALAAFLGKPGRK